MRRRVACAWPDPDTKNDGRARHGTIFERERWLIERKAGMITRSVLRQAMIAVMIAALNLVLFAVAQPASAQLFWDWGGGDERDGSGRELVRFGPQFATGEIIVSFGDRRLYFVTRPGEAISYPIAIPRDQDRWQGVTKISDKKVNPPLPPTAD